jgi:hypothetical protein
MEKYFQGAIINKLFPKIATGSQDRMIDNEIFLLLQRN